VVRIREKKKSYQVLVGQPEWNSPIGRPRVKWECNIKINLLEQKMNMDWVHLAQHREQRQALVNTVKNIQVPQNTEKFLTSC
jgi:hypothetical protein